MMAFALIAATLAAALAAYVAWPLVRGASSAPAAPRMALAAAAVIILGAAGMYTYTSEWTWPAHDAAAADTTVSKLARRLEKQPDDIDGWLMLGRSYAAIEQLQLALRSFARADRLAEGRNVEALVGMAEVLMREDPNELTGRAGELLDRAIAQDPKAAKALFFGALSSQQRGKLPEARERFVALMALEPPMEVRSLIERQVAAIDVELAGASASAAPASAPSPEAAGGATVRVVIDVSPALKAKLPAGAPLFVFVRDVAGGPPLAVRRLDATFPQTVELGAGDVMIQGRGLTPGTSVSVVARVASGGTPTATSGDPFGELRYDVGKDGARNLVIDRLTP